LIYKLERFLALNDGIITGEIQTIKEEVFMAYSKVLFQHLAEETEENHKQLQSG
jgi:hypothetical protein